MLNGVSSKVDTRDDFGGALADLRVAATGVADAENRLGAMRSRRDELIRTAVSQGATERAAAEAAGVAPSYAHLAAKNGRFARVAARRR